MSEEEGWEFVKVDNQQLAIKTTALDEKCTAVEMLICYARELGAGFQPYAETVLELAVPLLKFYFHEGVREAGAMVLPYLLKCMKLANMDPTHVNKLWITTCRALLLAINDESEPETLYHFLASFCDCLETMGDNCMLNGQSKDGGPSLLSFYAKSVAR